MLTPVLLCLLPVWMTPAPASTHPQQSRCQLVQATALCDHGELSAVPPGLPAHTEELQLNYNSIRTLQNDAIARYPALTSLSLACNCLQTLESNTFQHNKMLQSLNLANNDLHIGYQESSCALKLLPGLRALDLSENKLHGDMAAALLQNLTSLEHLNLSGNLLQRLDEASFKDLHQLKELDLQRNILFELDGAFGSNTKLQRLNLAFNYLPCLMDFHMTQLVVLNLSHNFIEWFISRQDVNDTFQLETLDLSDNQLLFFPFLPDRSRLRHLHLSHNAIGFYERLADNATVEFYNVQTPASNVTAPLWDDGLHGDVSSLELLDLGGNQVEYFPQGFIQRMPSLSRLRMCTNCLQTLNFTWERFPGSLYELDVSNNRLGQIVADAASLAALGNLTYVNLSQNRLERLPARLFAALPSLRSADLSYNHVDFCLSGADAVSACVDWTDVASLRRLYLKGCGIRRIPSSALAGLSLTHLELSDNPGLTVGRSVLGLGTTLQHLGLGNTRIRDLDFSPFLSLKYLNMSGNSLVHLPSSLVGLDLKVLDLRDNQLATIPPEQASALAPKLHHVFLTGNPFNCCQAEWFRTFEAAETVNMVGKSDIECEDLVRVTHRAEHYQAFLCLDEDGESIFWYILLFVPIGVFLVGISIVVLLTFKPKILQKTVKKKCLKSTSY